MPLVPSPELSLSDADVAETSVLLVDDEENIRFLARLQLERGGSFEVVGEAHDGLEAIELAGRLQPSVILLDVMMPRMDGWQVLTELKSDPDLQDIPVVMLTAKVQDQDQIRGWSAGASEYITKPFSPLSLSQVLDDVLAGGPSGEARRRELVLEKLRLLRQNSGGGDAASA